MVDEALEDGKVRPRRSPYNQAISRAACTAAPFLNRLQTNEQRGLFAVVAPALLELLGQLCLSTVLAASTLRLPPRLLFFFPLFSFNIFD